MVDSALAVSREPFEHQQRCHMLEREFDDSAAGPPLCRVFESIRADGAAGTYPEDYRLLFIVPKVLTVDDARRCLYAYHAGARSEEAQRLRALADEATAKVQQAVEMAMLPVELADEWVNVLAVARERSKLRERFALLPRESDDIGTAAACYAAPVRVYRRVESAGTVAFHDLWPWEEAADFRPTYSRRRRLAHAAALALTELAMLDRLKVRRGEVGEG